MLNGGQGAPGPVSPSAEDVWESLPVTAPPAWSRVGLGAGTGSGCLAQGLSSGLVAPGRAGATLCPSSLLPPHSLLSFLPYIQRFIFYTRHHLQISSSAGADGCPLGEETLLLCPECSMDTSHAAWWESTLQPHSPVPGAAVALPVLQCWEGAGACQPPWAGAWGQGWAGGGVILFCSLEMCPIYAPLQLGLDGGIIFYLARERPAK